MAFNIEKKFILNCISFMIGALPLAVIIPWLLYRIDVRKYGSKNPGTTNVYRVLKQQRGTAKALVGTILVGLLDIAKGFIPAIIYPAHGPLNCLFAVLGHIYSPFLGFSGGKGVATFLGAFIGSTWSGLFMLPPVIWSILTFNTKLLSKIGIKSEWVNIYGVQIKTSFFLSLITMSISMIMFLFTDLSMRIKASYLGMLIFVIAQHWEYIRIGDEVQI